MIGCGRFKSKLMKLHPQCRQCTKEIDRSRRESADVRREMEATRSLPLRLNIQKPGQTASTDCSVVGDQKISGIHLGIHIACRSRSARTGRKPAARQRETGGAPPDESREWLQYRVRLSGIVLLNAVENREPWITGFSIAAPSPPHLARPRKFWSNFAAVAAGTGSFRPEIHGARISGDVQFDFAGSSYNLSNGTTFGFARLRTGVVRLEWPNTSLIAGQDAPFFSPLSPSSIASLALPELPTQESLDWIHSSWGTPHSRGREFEALASSRNSRSGNWRSHVFAIFTPPLAGEASRQPAYAMRLAWSYRFSITISFSAWQLLQSSELGPQSKCGRLGGPPLIGRFPSQTAGNCLENFIVAAHRWPWRRPWQKRVLTGRSITQLGYFRL